MSKTLPVISGKKLISFLASLDYEVVRQRGSHVRLEKLTKAGTHKITIPNHDSVAKGSRKNNFTELAPRFRLALFDPKSQNHSNSRTLSRILRLRIGQRWPEDGMLKCEVIFERALRVP